MIAGFLLALVLTAAAGLLVMGPMMGQGGMMDSGAQGGARAWTWVLAAVLLALAGGAVVVGLRRGASAREAVSPRPGSAISPAPLPTPSSDTRAPPRTGAAPPSTPASELEAIALRLLDRDERLLFIEVKEKGGTALQKDLGHRDGFSRSKVTRTLDRLQAKGLVARDRNGMTNRVRLLTRPGGPPST